MRSARVPLAVLASAVVLGACAGSPNIKRAPIALSAGDQLLVDYRGQKSKPLAMRNESSLAPDKAYQEGNNVPLKVIDDQQASLLMDALATRGFFAAAMPAAAPQAVETIRVVHNGRSYVMSKLPGSMTTAEAITEFRSCQIELMAVYNANNSYHTRRNTSTMDLYNQKYKVKRDTIQRLQTELRKERK